MSSLNNLHEKIETLCRLIPHLDADAQLVQAESSDGKPWRDSLLEKLRYQSSSESPLIVAVTGGTNIGKSTVFNHLAQSNASGVCPIASGTKYPVCLAPKEWADEQKLQNLFPGFDVQPWSDSQAPLENHSSDVLYWKEGENVPPQLILLDTPDVDSTNSGNWRRAEKIRQAADVLIAVLTQQKYNDNVCAEFFRQASESGKAFIAVFNQVDLEYIPQYLPIWLETFVNQVQQSPILVYAAPHDKTASSELCLPFYNVGLDGKTPVNQGGNLQDELVKLHFDELKTRSMAQSLRDAMNGKTGLGAWLEQIVKQSELFGRKKGAFNHLDLGQMDAIPLPRKMVVDEIIKWWDLQRIGWVKTIYWGYQQGAAQLTSAVKFVWKKAVGDNSKSQPTPEELFLEQEEEVMVHSAGSIITQLQLLADTDEILGTELKEALSGSSVEQIFAQIKEEHAKLPALTEDFRQYLSEELSAWRLNHPKTAFSLKALDTAIGVARPIVTVALGAFMFGGPDVLLPIAAAGAGGLIDPTEPFAQFFKNVQNRYCIQRVEWLRKIIKDALHIDEFMQKLEKRIEVKNSPEIIRAQQIRQELAEVP